MKDGRIIFLNGASSSGKTTLLKGLQDKLNDVYLEFGLDKFIWMLPKRYLDQPLWDDVLGKADIAGKLGHYLVRAMHRAIYSMAKSGFNLLVDHVLVEPVWVEDCAAWFASLDAYLIAVKCDLHILEQREKDRKDRTLGQARRQFAKVHAHGIDDFSVDSGKYTPEENICQILDFLDASPPPVAFKTLRKKISSSQLNHP